ncbi:MAG: choice-of-anchor D domain-containing protein [Alphaproteobacteria bacterium]|nr:choice-of-anchor D domain-containing protein [Alphaproteobacteria bacterium]
MLLLLLSACIEQQVSALDPSLELSADALDFEEVVRGTRVTLTFFARNEGGGVLQVDSLALTEASDPTFSVDALEVDRIDPGEELPLRVSYAPEEIGVDWGELELITDDPERPTRRVSLSGEGVDPRLDVDPEALWFGDVLAGDSRLDVDLTARGQGWLNIREITLDDAEGAAA